MWSLVVVVVIAAVVVVVIVVVAVVAGFRWRRMFYTLKVPLFNQWMSKQKQQVNADQPATAVINNSSSNSFLISGLLVEQWVADVLHS